MTQAGGMAMSTSSVSDWTYRTRVHIKKLYERLPDVQPRLNHRDFVEDLKTCEKRLVYLDEIEAEATISVPPPDDLFATATMDIPRLIGVLVRMRDAMQVVENETPQWMTKEFAAVRTTLAAHARELAVAATIIILRAPVLLTTADTKDRRGGRMSAKQLVYRADRAHNGEPGRRVLYHEWVYAAEPKHPATAVRVLDEQCSYHECRAPIGKPCRTGKPLWSQHPVRVLNAVCRLAGVDE